MPQKTLPAETPVLPPQNPPAMKPGITRVCIYPKDIQRITGKSERHSRGLIHKIKASLNKPGHQILTVREFCTYMGIPYESVQEIIKD